MLLGDKPWAKFIVFSVHNDHCQWKFSNGSRPAEWYNLPSPWDGQ
jgi:hypothetical protein